MPLLHKELVMASVKNLLRHGDEEDRLLEQALALVGKDAVCSNLMAPLWCQYRDASADLLGIDGDRGNMPGMDYSFLSSPLTNLGPSNTSFGAARGASEKAKHSDW
jgi:hypothetical protein